MINTNSMPNGRQAQKIEELLTRGVENVFPNKDLLRKKLASGEKLKFYLGIDPTGPTLHMGHAIPLMKLADLQKLGHEVILLIGDFTAKIGDPTDKSATRKQLTRKEVLVNSSLYKKQASKFLNFGFGGAKLVYNSKWLAQMNFENVVSLASKITVQQMIQRDMFQERLKDEKPIHMHEFLYPLMQGYDSVAMNVDGEIGGNDQTFNMLAGRDLMKEINGKEKFVIATKLLVDATGKKMGKTEGNMITLLDSPKDMFGKIMSWSDEMIGIGFELCTRLPMSEVEEIKSMPNPRNAKARLAFEVVKVFYSELEAKKAQEEFDKVFRNKELPSEIPVLEVASGEHNIVDLLCLPSSEVGTTLASSKNEAKRLVDGGGVEVINDDKKERITDWKKPVEVKDGMIIKVGSRKFVKISLR